VAFFSMIMGLGGLAIAHFKVAAMLGWSDLPGQVLTWFATGCFAILALAYVGKLLRCPGNVIKEFDSPITLHFFPTITISLLLLAIAFLHHHPLLSFWLWTVGTVGHLSLTLATISIWIQKRHFEMSHMKPTWFIPVVGNILVPVAGVAHAPLEVNWFFFSIGLVFWLMLFTIFLNRIVFHEPIAEKRLPTLFILIAPPAVGFIAYLRLGGELDAFARILFGTAAFLFLLLLVQFRLFLRLRFALSWWAYSFPLAALTVASVVYQQHAPDTLIRPAIPIFLGLVSLLILGLLIRTGLAVARHQICTPDH
jgi:tellurite resistance protein